MKKIKNLMLMLALALFFVGAMGMTKASATDAETPTSTPAAAITATPEYGKERIKVACAQQVYYQIVKTADQKSNLKTANWIKAAKDTDAYYIDFSGTANGKDAFFALTTDASKGDATVVATVDAKIKSVKVGLNYETETIPTEEKPGLDNIIATLNVKGVESGDDNDEGKATDYSLKWKRGANGTWAAETAFTQLDWDMLKASNGTLYIAIDGKAAPEEFRMSKEAKVKIPKSAKAPTVKVDYAKGTIALKNGMQVCKAGTNKWMDVVAYDKSGKNDKIFEVDPTAKTSKKVSSVTVQEFVKALKDNMMGENLPFSTAEIADGATISIEVRTAATDKKFPSMSGSMDLVLPKAAPTVLTTSKALDVEYTVADRAKKVDAAYELDFSKLFTLPATDKYSDYEYIFVAAKDDGVNLAKQKWTKLEASGKVDLAKYIGKDYKYYKKDATSTTEVKYEEIKAVYIRLSAVKATKDVTGVFASEYGVAEVNVTKKAAATTNPSQDENQGEQATTYTISCETSGVTFKVDGTGVTKAAKDAEVTIEYTPEGGKSVTAITVTPTGGEAITVNVSATPWKFTMPEANVTVTITEGDAT